MAFKLLAILCIIPIIYAKIDIDISATEDNERDVRISGRTVDLISDMEKKAFDLTEDKLKKAITNFFGWTPDNVYVKGPTPWGGLYKSLRWEPVKKIFQATKATILSIESKPELLTSKDISNQESEEKIQKEKIEHEVETKISSKWDKDEELDADDIHYHVEMKKPEDSMYVQFTAKLGEDAVKKMPLKVESEVEIQLKPKQNAKVAVHATKETMKIRVDYETSLVGAVAVNYDKEYKGHRFWAMDINTVLEAGDLKKKVHTSELIEVVHYTDAKVLVKDADTNEVIYSAPLEMH